MAKEEKIQIVVVPSSGKAKAITVVNELKTWQNIVGGLIEYLAADFEYRGSRYAFICNEEGKISQLQPGRAVYIKNDKAGDIVFGDFIVTKHDENGDFASLSDEEAQHIINEMNLSYRDPWPYIMRIMAENKLKN